jgi:hypothetical protein
MPKFSALNLEQPPIRKVPFVTANSGERVEVGVQVLPAGARLGAIERARKRCQSQGVEKWDDKDPTCSLEFYIEVIALACVTSESTTDSTELFFDSADQIRADRRVGQENVTYLYEVFELHESEYSVRPTKMSMPEAVALCIRLASEGEAGDTDGFLDRSGPAMLKSLVLTLANLLFSSAAGSSPSVLAESPSVKTLETSTSKSS